MKVFPKCDVMLTDKFYADRAVVHAVVSVRDSRYKAPRTYIQPFQGLLVWILLNVFKVDPLKRKNVNLDEDFEIQFHIYVQKSASRI